MRASVRFYRDVLGLELVYGGEDAYFSSLRMKNENSAFANLEQGNPVAEWGRLIFHRRMWTYSGRTFGKRNFIRRGRGTLPGASGIFTCAIPMAMSCRLRVRSSSLLVSAGTHFR